MILVAVFVLLLCQLAGEVLGRLLHLPVPGPVLGMALLALWYAVRRREPERPMRQATDGLLRWLGLLFVPAGVGVFANLELLRAAWLPLTVALAGSTLLTLLTTALLMHGLARSEGQA